MSSASSSPVLAPSVPVGNDATTAWKAMVEGRSGVRRITKFDASGVRQ